MVDNLTCILNSCQLQIQLFLLQFITCNVVFQDCALFPAGFHVGNDFIGQFHVLLQYLDLIVQFVEVQVMPY